MAYLDSANLAEDANFLQVVYVAMITAALDVVTEDPNTASHTERVAFATSILRQPNSFINSFAFAVVCNPAVPATFNQQKGRYTTTASDSDIQFTVNSDFNSLAGISS